MLARTLKLKYDRLLIAVLLCMGVLYSIHRLATSPDGNATRRIDNHGTPVRHSSIESDSLILEKLDIQRPFEFRRYCMGPRKQKGLSRERITNISYKLPAVTLLSPIDQPSGTQTLPPCATNIKVDVPPFDAMDVGDTNSILLGVATKLSRIESSLIEMSRWLSRTDTRLVVLVVDLPELEAETDLVASVYAKAVELDIDMILYPYPHKEDSEGLKNFGLAEPLRREAQKHPQIRWIGIIDDDTFFVSLPQMVSRLDTFDHRIPLYLGQLSEGWTRVSDEGFKAWGGGGIFLSVPLLTELANHVEECKSLDVGFGDILWRDCIYHVTSPTVKLTQLDGLNQMDFWGDPSGWYEAGHDPILTIHHWKSWHFHPVPNAHLVTDVAGPDSFLQRYIFTNDSSVLTNGYSFVYYPAGIPDLNLVESTMTEDVGIERSPPWKEFHLSMGRTRPAMEHDVQKMSWIFSHASTDSDGNVRQFYLKRNVDGNGMTSVVEFDWIKTGNV